MTSKCSKNKKVVTDVLCILSYRFENAKPIGPYIRYAVSIYWWTAKQSVFLCIQVRASSQTKGLEWGWKQRARLGRDAFSLARRACEARALRARKILTPRFIDFFTDFEKKTDCFAVYLSIVSAFPWNDCNYVKAENQSCSGVSIL